LYGQGNDFEIIGASHAEYDMRAMISAQMDDIYFPITMREFSAHVYFRDLTEGDFDIWGIKVRSLLLSHPGNCLGYRIDYQGRSICYITDNEMFPDWTPYYNERYFEQLSGFVAGADALITDATYTDEEYRSKVTWGHSCLSEVARLAASAKIKTLYLFHHDPDQTDDDIDAKLVAIRQRLSDLSSDTLCVAPREGEQFKV
jgi:phosphoribosyl 1,2-cyclic phosphodiesterase